ncbi:MAG: hypothetical protein M1484_04600 [Patescibacteria group bacterium]|nr:hypothetical protein [Patescibacteria group bacterium]MCL5432336.1 hypothetical protein [Patescibacteria group bacterium]
MLRNILLAIILLFLICANSVYAIYDPLSVPNNRIGIHILDVSELAKAASLVNTTGGDWGYVTIPIQANDRNLVKWTQFMQDCHQLHLIPILRIASFPVSDYWMAPNEWDLVDFANFLDELPWPTNDRYVVIYNEPNHKNEWGGFIYPAEYAQVLNLAVDIFHRQNPNFFVISAGFDSAAPDNEYDYMRAMNAAVPGIFNKIDGFSSHSYGNPDFSSFPNVYSRINVANYRFEENFLSTLGVPRPKLFLTEAGWHQDVPTSFFSQAFNDIWTDDNIVAITPFLLSAQAGPFVDFSFTDGLGNFSPAGKLIQNLPKIAGRPELASMNIATQSAKITPWNGKTPPTSNFDLIGSLEQIFFRMFGEQK